MVVKRAAKKAVKRNEMKRDIELSSWSAHHGDTDSDEDGEFAEDVPFLQDVSFIELERAAKFRANTGCGAAPLFHSEKRLIDR